MVFVCVRSGGFWVSMAIMTTLAYIHRAHEGSGEDEKEQSETRYQQRIFEERV